MINILALAAGPMFQSAISYQDRQTELPSSLGAPLLGISTRLLGGQEYPTGISESQPSLFLAKIDPAAR